jgi:hypothetical protein
LGQLLCTRSTSCRSRALVLTIEQTCNVDCFSIWNWSASLKNEWFSLKRWLIISWKRAVNFGRWKKENSWVINGHIDASEQILPFSFS